MSLNRYKSTNPHYQDLSDSYSQSSTERVDGSSYSVVAPTFSQAGAGLNSKEHEHKMF